MLIVCPQCGFSRDVSPERLKGHSVIVTCPKCACRFRFSKNGVTEILPDGKNDAQEEEDIRQIASRAYEAEAQRFKKEQTAAEAARAENPWQTAPGTNGWFSAFFQTIFRVMFQAPAFFAFLSGQSKIGRAFGFFIILAVLQTVIDQIWGDLMLGFLKNYSENDPQIRLLAEAASSQVNLPLNVLLRCGFLVLQLYVFSYIMFGIYRLLAGQTATFSLIFQIMAYSYSPMVLCVIPIAGTLIGSLWGLGCLVIGCKTALKLDWPRTLTGFIPVLLIMGYLVSQIFDMLAGA